MVDTCFRRLSSLAVAAVMLVATSASGQQSPSGIAGVVRDDSGGVLPGVTVEAASPALIEKVRTVVSNEEGRFNIIDLRPGTYTVTFTLVGFSTLRREGIELTAGFTASVNADMKVGALEETITVSGAAPLVDTQSSRHQTVVSSELLTVLPTGQTNVASLIALTPGYFGNATVGGSTGSYHSQQSNGSFHGKLGTHILYDGMRIQNYSGTGQSAGYIFNHQTVEETAVETGGAGAESGAPGVAMNMIPKEGANSFKYMVASMYTNKDLQSDNLDDELLARGLTSVPSVERMYDLGATAGGPIRRDSLWFFGAFRRWGTRNQAAGLYYNKTQGTPFYTPDLSRPAARDEWYRSHAARLTWQVSSKNKVNIFVDIKKDCVCATGGVGSQLGSGATNAQEAVSSWKLFPSGILQGTWTSPRTSRLLLEAGATVVMFHRPDFLLPGVSRDQVSILEQTGVAGGAPGNFRYNAPATVVPERSKEDRYSQRFAMSYVTGSHTMKAGIQVDEGHQDRVSETVGLPEAKGVSWTFSRGVPVSVTYNAAPSRSQSIQKAELGIYAQDSWTLRRLTVSYGVRYDYVNGYVPALSLPATQFLPAREFPAAYKVPAWKDINPRFGGSVDVFGNGRTALKASLGRYSELTNPGFISANNPVAKAFNTTSRSWNDANGNYYPDCDLKNFVANGECGGIANLNYGKSDPNATVYADDVRLGFGARPATWDFGSELQHQLGAAVSVTLGYYRNWDQNFRVTDNVEVASTDFSPYCVTAPVDPRLPGGGGYQVCGLFDVNADKFGRTRNLVTKSSRYGEQSRVNNFYAVSVDTRFRSGIRLGGGLDLGRTVEDSCFVVDSPQQLVNCRVVTPVAGTSQVKLRGSYPLPAGVVFSGTLQNLPGLSYTASYSATTAEIAPSLGRPLAGGTRTAAVPLVAPQTLREPRRTQIDLRLTKNIELTSKARLQANFDLYNATNSNAVLGANNTYGAQWRQPTLILSGRLIQISGTLTF